MNAVEHIVFFLYLIILVIGQSEGVSYKHGESGAGMGSCRTRKYASELCSSSGFCRSSICNLRGNS